MISKHTYRVARLRLLLWIERDRRNGDRSRIKHYQRQMAEMRKLKRVPVPEAVPI